MKVDRSNGHYLSNKRPCFLILFPFLIGTIVAKYLMPQPFLWSYFIIAVILIASAVIAFRDRRLVNIMVAVFAFVLAVIVAGIFLLRHDEQVRLAASLVPSLPKTFVATLLEDPILIESEHYNHDQSPIYARVRVLIESLEINQKLRPFRARALLKIIMDNDSDFRYGDRVKCTGELYEPGPLRNPGCFNYAEWLGQQGIFIQGEIESPEDIQLIEHNRGNPLRRALWTMRRALRRGLMAGEMRSSSRAFLLGMTIGERGLVDDDLREALVNTNSMHILAISGLHVGILAFAMLLVLKIIPMRRDRRFLAIALILFLYAALLDFRPPAFRAAIMISAFLIAPLFRRESDPLNTLAFAVIIMLLFRPLDLFSASFQLSVLIVFTLIMIGTPLIHFVSNKLLLKPDKGFLVVGATRRKIYTFVLYFVALFVTSVAAFVGSTPLSAYYFHILNPLSILSNMIIIPFVTFIVPLGLLSAVLGLLSVSASAALNFLNDLLITGMTTVVTSFSRASFSVMYLKAPALLSIVGYYFIVGLVGFSSSFSSRTRTILVVLLFLALVLVPISSFAPDSGTFRITILDIQRSEVRFIEMPNGRNLLMNTGLEDGRDARWTIHPFLKASGINSMDSIVLTRLDRQHCGGLEFILDRHKVSSVILPGGDDSLYADAVISMLRRRNMKIIEIAPGAAFDIFTSPSVRIWSPKPDTADSEAKPALLTLLAEEETKVLIVERPELQNLSSADMDSAKGGRLALVCTPGMERKLDILKLKEKLGPHIVVIEGAGRISKEDTDQENNPDSQPVLSTERHGAITIHIFKNNFEIRTMLPYNP